MLIEFHNQKGSNILHKIPGQLVYLDQSELLQYTFASDLQIQHNKQVFSYIQKNIQGIQHYVITYRFTLPDAYQRACQRKMVLLLLIEEQKVKRNIFRVRQYMQQIEQALYKIFYNIYEQDIQFCKNIYLLLKSMEEEKLKQIIQEIYSFDSNYQQVLSEIEELIENLQDLNTPPNYILDKNVEHIFELNQTDFNQKDLDKQNSEVAKIQFQYMINKQNISDELLQKLIQQCQIYRNSYLIYREYDDLMKNEQLQSIEMLLKLLLQYLSVPLKEQLLQQYFSQSTQVFYMQDTPIYCMLDGPMANSVSDIYSSIEDTQINNNQNNEQVNLQQLQDSQSQITIEKPVINIDQSIEKQEIQQEIYIVTTEEQEQQCNIQHVSPYDIENLRFSQKPPFVYKFQLPQLEVNQYNIMMDRLIDNKRKITEIFDWFSKQNDKQDIKMLILILMISINNLKIFIQEENSELISFLNFLHFGLEPVEITFLSKIFDRIDQVQKALKINKDLKIIRLGKEIRFQDIKRLVNQQSGLFVNFQSHFSYVSEHVKIPQKAYTRFQTIFEELKDISNSIEFQQRVQQLVAEQIACNTVLVLSNM